MNVTALIVLGIFFITGIVVYKILKKEIPQLLKQKKEEWKEETKKAEVKKIYEDENNLKIKKVIQAENRKKTYKENIKNGKKYEAHVAEHFRKLNYTVWEHGKEKGFKDENIDLFAMNKNEAFFIQCKYYRKSKVDHNQVKATRTDIRNYMQNNQEFTKLIKERKKKILYVIPKECLTTGAWRYIKENNEIMEYKVIPMIE